MSMPVLESTAVAKRLDPKVLAALRELGRQGGKKGGKARWRGVSAEERRAFARKGARARWRKEG